MHGRERSRVKMFLWSAQDTWKNSKPWQTCKFSTKENFFSQPKLPFSSLLSQRERETPWLKPQRSTPPFFRKPKNLSSFSLSYFLPSFCISPQRSKRGGATASSMAVTGPASTRPVATREGDLRTTGEEEVGGFLLGQIQTLCRKFQSRSELLGLKFTIKQGNILTEIFRK